MAFNKNKIKEGDKQSRNKTFSGIGKKFMDLFGASWIFYSKFGWFISKIVSISPSVQILQEICQEDKRRLWELKEKSS